MANGVRAAVAKLALAGLAVGAVAAWLVSQGNPGNMGVCVACFLRDTAGTFGGPALRMGAVAYLRPEIPGLLLGAAAAALVSREFRPRGGTAFLRRFALGFAFMLGALVFLGCTVRAWLRLGGGDLNAVVGLAGMAAGIAVGAILLRAGYGLGRARELPAAAGWVGPAVAVLLLLLAGAVALGQAPSFLTVTAPGVMPGGRRAPFAVSLGAGLLLGFVAQRSRLCTTGGIRDLILWRRVDKLVGVAGIVLGALAVNAALGQLRVGFVGQPVAHADTLGNFAGMAVAGLAAVLMGGCPLRQVVMSGEGDLDAVGAVLGMLAGALLAHGLQLASSPKGVAPGGLAALAVLAVGLVAFGLWQRRAGAGAGAAGPR